MNPKYIISAIAAAFGAFVVGTAFFSPRAEPPRQPIYAGFTMSPYVAPTDAPTPEPTPTQDANAHAGQPECLVVLRNSLENASRSSYDAGVKGRVENRCTYPLRYVEVSINFKNSEGAVVDSALSNMTNLEAGQQWDFYVTDRQDSSAWELVSLRGNK